MQDMGNSEDKEDVEAEDVVYCDEVELFDESAQNLYLFELRLGKPVRMAARAVGFTPRAVREYRKRNAIFDEECEENIAEADEEVEWEARKAMKAHEPYAVKLLAERQGWKREAKQSQGGASGLPQIEGNPMERIMKLQAQIANRSPEPIPESAPVPAIEPVKKGKPKKVGKPKPKFPEPSVIDVSLADDDA